MLVVDDAALDRYVASALLEEHPGWYVRQAEDGRDALSTLKRELPDIIITDLQMPEISGLELVEAVRRDYPAVPMILMTAHGSEEVAIAALRLGASSYVPKRNLARDLVGTVEKLLTITHARRNQQVVLDCLTEGELRFAIPNDVSRIQALVGHFQDVMAQLKLVNKNGLIRVGTALHEALVNAIEHGNLEVPSALRAQDDRRPYQALVEQRRGELPYRERKVHVVAQFSSTQASYVIRDEGPGFDPTGLPDPTDPANFEKESGRGILLIRTFMDEVRFNAAGNEITMVKRRA
jgi:CheY-like chemotaxis protein